jgi:hypothetical protein
MTRPSLRRLLWVHNSARPHHMGRSGAATCTEKVIYPKASTVSLDPHGRVPDPLIYSLDIQGWSRTSTCARRTLGMGSEPPPPVWGSDRPQWGPRIEYTRALNRTQAGVWCRHVSGPSLVGSEPVRIHSCPPLRRRPVAATWHTARGLSQRAERSMTPLGYVRLRIHCG